MNKYRVKITYEVIILGKNIDEAETALQPHFPDDTQLSLVCDVIAAKISFNLAQEKS